VITFYAPKDPYGFFSNFSRHEVEVFGQTWFTSEHAFQAMKFHPHRPDLVARVAAAVKPHEAATIGRDTSLPLHPEWEQQIPWGKHIQVDDGVNRMGVTAEPAVCRYKDRVMYQVVHAKFSKRADLRAELLATGDHVLIEDAIHDPYWGWGASHVGLNKLGRILMAVRASLRAEGVVSP
jgi:predicted NAD-dependent protein-ADP-ribosyltransferase YbiA (DUF1768 family)